MASPLPSIASPCINVCSVDPETRCCDGCGRSLKEIAQWSRMSNDDRADIMAALPKRLEGFAARRAALRAAQKR